MEFIKLPTYRFLTNLSSILNLLQSPPERSRFGGAGVPFY